MHCSEWRISRYNDLFDHLVGARKRATRRSSAPSPSSTLAGSNDKLWGEHDPGVDGICDEAMGFDAFHGFAGRLKFGFALEGDTRADRDLGDVIFPLNILKQTFGFAFISGRDQALGLSEREECQHHARIERANEQFFGRPDARFAFELRRAADNDVRSFRSQKNTAPRRTPSGFRLIVKRLVGLGRHENLRVLWSRRTLARRFTPSAISRARAL